MSVEPTPPEGTRRRTAVLVAAGLVVIAAVDPARATADGPDWFRVRGVAATDVLNIRAEKGAHSRKVGEIPPGARCVRNLGCSGGLTLREFTELTPEKQRERERENARWCRIEYAGVQGWVAGRYVEEDACPR
jgi:uncharacterized protein YraI